MLERHIEIFNHFVVGGNLVYEVVRDVLGVTILQSYPLDAVNKRQLMHKCRQSVHARIHAIIGGVLRHKNKFFHALRRHLPCLGDNTLLAARAEFSPQFGYDAICAAVVAAVGNLEISRVGRGTAYARQILRHIFVGIAHYRFFCAVGIVFVYNDGDFCVIGCAQDYVNLGQLFLYFFLISLCETARDNKQFAVIFLILCHFEYGVYGFLLGAVYKRTGVHHNHIGIRRVGGYLIAVSRQQTEHGLGVGQIFGTAE